MRSVVFTITRLQDKMLTHKQSLKVRSGYIDHLRKFEIVPRYFIPTIFSLLRLYNGMPKAVKLDIWAVDEFYIQCNCVFAP